ncbi:hypothetical protein CAPTEDRAFT_24259, partial [Capitella teleta]
PGNEDSGMFAPQIAIAVLISIVMVVSLTGNSLVLMVIINTRSLRRLNNMLIVSLATIDLVRSVVVMPLFIVVELSVVTQLPKGLCPMYHALHLSCEMVSIYNLTVISLERVFVISRPLVYQLMITLRKMAVLVCVLWVLGFVYGSLQIVWFIPKKDIPEFSGFNPSAYAYQDSSEDGVCQYAPSPEYAIVDFVICLVAPLLIMISCYLKIFCVVQSQMKRIAPTSTNIDCSDIMTVTMTQRSRMRINSSASIMTNTSTKSKRGLFRLSDNKAVRMTSIVVGAFMICWLPYNIIFLLKQMHPDCVSALTWDIFSSLVFLSSAINPFIYNFYSGEFRRALRRILT